MPKLTIVSKPYGWLRSQGHRQLTAPG
ncbi:hypothetical protein BGLA2_860016 [Burkholderia gladioli]|nr:hypothetical protein BGLA2_860016 [Burkholderia gladioli]